MRVVAQFGARLRDVAPPVALTHYAVLVVVERDGAACEAADVLAAGRDCAQEPQRCLDAGHPRVAQFAYDEVAEGARGVNAAVADKQQFLWRIPGAAA